MQATLKATEKETQSCSKHSTWTIKIEHENGWNSEIIPMESLSDFGASISQIGRNQPLIYGGRFPKAASWLSSTAAYVATLTDATLRNQTTF